MHFNPHFRDIVSLLHLTFERRRPKAFTFSLSKEILDGVLSESIQDSGVIWEITKPTDKDKMIKQTMMQWCIWHHEKEESYTAVNRVHISIHSLNKELNKSNRNSPFVTVVYYSTGGTLL